MNTFGSRRCFRGYVGCAPRRYRYTVRSFVPKHTCAQTLLVLVAAVFVWIVEPVLLAWAAMTLLELAPAATRTWLIRLSLRKTALLFPFFPGKDRHDIGRRALLP